MSVKESQRPHSNAMISDLLEVNIDVASSLSIEMVDHLSPDISARVCLEGIVETSKGDSGSSNIDSYGSSHLRMFVARAIVFHKAQPKLPSSSTSKTVLQSLRLSARPHLQPRRKRRE